MRRIIAILLLSLLPVQFVWSAVDGYGGHDEQSVGLHLHAPIAAADLDAGGDVGSGHAADAQAPVAELICGDCHCSCTGIFHSMGPSAGDLPHGQPRPAHDATGGPPPPARPERPQWLGLA